MGFYTKIPFYNGKIGKMMNHVKISANETGVERGVFLMDVMENGEIAAKVGSTASTDKFLGIANTGSIGTKKPVIISDIVPDNETKTYTLPSIPDANSFLVKVDGVVKTVTTDYTISGTSLSFVSESINAGQKFEITYRTDKTPNEILNSYYPADTAYTTEGYVDVCQSGTFLIDNFDTTVDWESATTFKVDANGNLTTTGNGVDITNKIHILKAPSYGNAYLEFELLI